MDKRIKEYLLPILGFAISILFNAQQIFTSYILGFLILIGLFIKIILNFAGLVTACIGLEEHNNRKSNILAIGYVGSSFFILLYIYYIYNQDFMVKNIVNAYYQSAIGAQILQVLSILIVLVVVEGSKNIGQWVKGIYVILVINIVFSWRLIQQRNTIDILAFKHVHDIVCLILVTMLVLGVFKAYISKQNNKNQKLIIEAILYKVIYLLTISLFDVKFSILVVVVNFIDLVHCFKIYRFIYQESIMGSWKKVDANLEENEMKLKQEEIEKHNLVYASSALQKYMKDIAETSTHLKRRLEKTKEISNMSHIDKINKNCNRLMKLSNNIIVLGKIDAGNIVPSYKITNMNQLVQVLVESISPYIESKGLKIKVSVDKKPIFCYIDADEIERVILNLISNAIKYNKNNGMIEIYINERQGKAYLAVKDSGIGIPQEKLQMIFKRFERVDNGFVRTQEGSGLGLCIVKSIVEMNKGKIKILSKENEGTMVSICLPIYKKQKGKRVELRKKEVLKKKVELEFSDLNK